MDDTTRPEYVGSGPRYPAETFGQAVAGNTAHHLAGQMLARASTRPGHGFEHEPLDATEQASQGTAQHAAASAHTTAGRAVRTALRG